jgi:hypothetical protein
LIEILKAGRYKVPEKGEPVTETLAALIVEKEFQSIKSGEKSVNRVALQHFLGEGSARAIKKGWEVTRERGTGDEELWFQVTVPLTPPPIQAEDVQKLETQVADFKTFLAQTLQGEALMDPKTKANILMSFQVKVGQLRSDAAMYSFAPGSKWDITFPTFLEVRSRGLVVCSRITDRVYLGIDQLISRLVKQQFQRMVRSRVGLFKALYWSPKGQMTYLQKTSIACVERVKALVERSFANAGVEGETSHEAGWDKGEGLKAKLKQYVKNAERLGSQEEFPSSLETEAFSLYGNLFKRNLEDAGMLGAGGLDPRYVEAVALELLAMVGTLEEAREKGEDGSKRINLGSGTWTFQGKAWRMDDDPVIRGLAMLAVHGDAVQRMVGMAAKARYGEAVRQWVQTIYQDQLSGVRSEIRFGQQELATRTKQKLRGLAVLGVRERKDLFAAATVILDEPDLRRLVALIEDEVQQFAIPPTGKNPGDGGYLEVARAGMAMNVMATQMPHSLKDTLKDSFNRYLGNVLTWIVLRQPLEEDAKIVANLIGTEAQNEQLKLSATMQAASGTGGEQRGTVEDYNLSWESRGEQRQRVSVTELLEQEAMQAFAVVSDGQRRNTYKLYTTPFFVILGKAVNPYGPKGLLLNAEEKMRQATRKGKEFILSYKEAMAITEDHGDPLVEMPVVQLIQYRVMDMSKTRSDEEIRQDARLHAMRAVQKIQK